MKGFHLQAMGSLGLRIGLLAINFAVSMTLARLLGPEEFGIYNFALALMMLVSLPGQAGLPMTIMRDISFTVTDGTWGRVRALIATSRLFVLGYSALAIIVTIAAYFLFLRANTMQSEALTLLYAGALIPSYILITVIGASLRGMQHLMVGQIVETLLRPTFLLIAIGLAFVLLAQRPDSSDIMLLHAVAGTFGLGCALLVQRRFLQGKPSQSEADAVSMRDLMQSVFPLALVAGMQVVIAKTDILMLRWLQSPEEVGQYQVALQLANMAMFAQQALLLVSGPNLAKKYRQGDHAAVQTVLTSTARMIFFSAAPIGIGLMLFGKEVIALTFGDAYIPAAAALFVLMFGRIVQASFGAVIQLAKVVSMEKLMFRLSGGAALLNIVLNWLLIPGYGIVGAAIASIVATFLWTIVLLGVSWRQFGYVSFIIYRGAHK